MYTSTSSSTCIHTYMHACIHTCIHAYIHTYIVHTYISCIVIPLHMSPHAWDSSPSSASQTADEESLRRARESNPLRASGRLARGAEHAPGPPRALVLGCAYVCVCIFIYIYIHINLFICLFMYLQMEIEVDIETGKDRWMERYIDGERETEIEIELWGMHGDL